MKNNIDLYHFPLTPASCQIRLMLGEKGFSWNDFHINPFAGEDLRIDYLSLDNQMRRPILVHDGRLVAGFVEIVDYIESHFRIVSLAPHDDDNLQRMVRLINLAANLPIIDIRLATLPGFVVGSCQKWLDRRINHLNILPRENPEIEESCRHSIRQHRMIKAILGNRAHAEKARAKIIHFLGKAEKRVTNRPYMMGKRYTLADAAWVGMLDCLRYYRIGGKLRLTAWPGLKEYHARCLHRPGAEPYNKSRTSASTWFQWGLDALTNMPGKIT